MAGALQSRKIYSESDNNLVLRPFPSCLPDSLPNEIVVVSPKRKTYFNFMALQLDFSLSSPLITNHFLTHAKSFQSPKSKLSSQFLRFDHHIPGKGWKTELCKKARIACSAKSGEIIEDAGSVKERSVSIVLLAGGKGKRMGASMPKQYLPLLGQPIALYSFYTFSSMVEVKEIVVVCDPSYKDIFEDIKEKILVDLKYALPGKERQDSVFNGLQEIDSGSQLVCIHDSARPLVLSGDVKKVLHDGLLHGAAVLGVPVKATIKEANNKSFVVRTLDRKTLWEMQTPQVVKPELLREGFELVNREGLEVTDDVSIVEHLKHPVYITEGSYTNIKVTTPDDLLLAERILSINSGVPSD